MLRNRWRHTHMEKTFYIYNVYIMYSVHIYNISTNTPISIKAYSFAEFPVRRRLHFLSSSQAWMVFFLSLSLRCYCCLVRIFFLTRFETLVWCSTVSHVIKVTFSFTDNIDDGLTWLYECSRVSFRICRCFFVTNVKHDVKKMVCIWNKYQKWNTTLA